MFKHILALNTYSEPFLSMRANDQRQIIEQLLGITLLSEKANVLKTDLKSSKDSIKTEEVRIATLQESNKKIEETIESLQRRQRLWHKSIEEKIANLNKQLDDLSHVDIEAELKAHEDLGVWKLKVGEIEDLAKKLNTADKTLYKATNAFIKAERNLKVTTEDMKCPTCARDLHDEKHQHLINDAKEEYDACSRECSKYQSEVDTIANIIDNCVDPGDKPNTFYNGLHEAHNHNSSLTHLTSQIKDAKAESDPYDEQIDDLQNEALSVISYDHMNELANLRDHQDFLLKLLTNKDSYIRKKIIDQNLSFLNARLCYYLDKIGLPHTVEFQNDLSVEIMEFGRDLDFDNLSRGERNRLILSLSWAFRDVWENLYQPVNLLFIDELIDSGMDASGVDSSLSILKKISRERKKSVWLVSHKDDLALRVNNVLTVTKENGYTTYSPDVTIA